MPIQNRVGAPIRSGRSPTRLSPMHRRHLALGASMVETGGWSVPARYSTVEEEVGRLTKAAGLCDVSHSVKLRLQGADAESWLARVFAGLGRLEVGAVGIHRAAVVARLASDEFLIVAGPSDGHPFVERLNSPRESCAHIVDISSGLGGVAVAGPSARHVLEAVTDLDVSPETFPDRRCAQAGFAEVHGTLLRTDLGELPYYELYFGRELGEYLWDALTEAGEEFGAVPFGVDAMARLRQTR